MSSMIETTALRHRDMFEMPNGSVYVTEADGDDPGSLKARLWCAHPPDPITFDPPLIDLPPGPVRLLLNRHETGVHVRHDGYVQQAHVTEMDRRHAGQMRDVYAEMHRKAAEARQQAYDRRSWWKKLFR